VSHGIRKRNGVLMTHAESTVFGTVDRAAASFLVAASDGRLLKQEFSSRPGFQCAVSPGADIHAQMLRTVHIKHIDYKPIPAGNLPKHEF
jgi:hypothetical protein